MALLSRILKAELFKITSLNALSIVLKIAIGLVTSKVIAVFVGPLGMGLVGNLRNFLSAAESWGTLGFQHGIVKYVAEHKDDKEKVATVFSTAFWTITTVLILTCLFLFVFAESVNQWLFGSFNYVHIIQVLALALPWYVFSLVFVAVLNGLEQYQQVVKINMIGNVIGLVFSVYLITYYQTVGALTAVILTPAFLFVVSLIYLRKQLLITEYLSLRFFNLSILKSLSGYSLMFFISAVISPFVYLEIRNEMIVTLGHDSAGYWEAVNRVSTYYLMFVSTLAGVYFFPRLSLTKSIKETQHVFWSYYRWIWSLFTAGLFVIYFFREWIVALLFTPAFEPVNELFFWQLFGDAFKAASLILGYQFLAKKMTAHFLITETISILVMYFSSLYFMKEFQTEGVVMAYALTYVIYFTILVVVFRKVLFGRNLALPNP